MLRKIYLAIALIAFTYSVKAEGYAVNLQGAKQTGMGHVGVAINWDASSMQFNPGALATLDAKYSLSMGGSLVWTNTEYTHPTNSALNTETDNPVSPPFYLYGSAKLTDKLAVGLAVYTPFGSSNVWGDDWAGKYLVQEIALKSIFIQPTVSYKVNDWISIGAGLNIVYGQFDLEKAVDLRGLAQNPAAPDGKATLSGSNVQYGYNIGVFLQPTEKLNVGISYRSQVDVDLDYKDGDVEFSVPTAFSSLFPNGGVKATLPLPASLNIGLAYQINKKWLISADINYVKWDAYKSLNFDFENESSITIPTSPTTTMDVPVVTDTKSTRDWDNSMTYRIGAQYSYNEKLDLRAGFYYDETPTNDQYYAPETPGANKIGITGGFSYLLNEKFSLDAAFIYSKGEKREAYDTNTASQGFGGEYQNTAFIPSLGITYNL